MKREAAARRLAKNLARSLKSKERRLKKFLVNLLIPEENRPYTRYIVTKDTNKDDVIRLEAAKMTEEKYPDQFTERLLISFGAKSGYSIDDEGCLFRSDGKGMHEKCDGPPNTEVERYYFEAIYFLGESSFFSHARDLSRVAFREEYIYVPTIALMIIAIVVLWG